MEEQGKQQEIEIEEVTAQENVIAVRDLVPMRAAMDDSMERIADMKDQFSQTIDPILRMYNAAMCATTARLEIIEDEFKYRKLRCPIHHIDTRLKSAKSILGKLQKKGSGSVAVGCLQQHLRHRGNPCCLLLYQRTSI